jgi:GT2 family glycosyltransferase
MIPSISLVFVLFGKRAVTEHGLASLERALGDTLGNEIELVLVDNASPDDTSDLLDAWEDRATVVRNGVNLNFSGGCNAGARACRGDVIVFLNNDMEFVPGAIETVAAAASEEGVGAIGARLLFPNGSIQHAGVVFVANEQGPPMPQHIFHHEAGDLPAATAVLDLDAVTGACLAIRRELLLEIGGFDEAYVNGLEDIDLCLRLRAAGLRVVYRGDVCLVHHESATRGIDVAASAHNDAVFQSRWGELCAPDDELARSVFGARLTVRGQLPLVPHEWSHGASVSVEGHLRSIAAEAAESRALLLALEVGGLAPAARDRLPAWLVADLSEAEEMLLRVAQTRLRSPTALRIEVPAGEFYSARRRHGDVLRLAAAPADPSHLAGVTAVWAATPSVADAIVDLGVDPGRVTYVPPPLVAPPAGSGGAGILVLLPGHDPAACAHALAGASHVPMLRLLPSLMTTELERLMSDTVPHAEVLAPTTSEARYAEYAADADGVLCLDDRDVFDRRALVAAAAGTAVATRSAGAAAAVLGSDAVLMGETDLARGLEQLNERAAGRAARRDAVLAQCAASCVAGRLGHAIAATDPEAPILSRLTPVVS